MALINTLLELQVLNAIQISPNRQKILYSTTTAFGNRFGDHDVSTIWLADTGHPKSARQLTPGTFNDHSPKWLPDGKSIVFISDRAKAGEQWAIYRLAVDSEEEPIPLTPKENEKKMGELAISPDGKYIAWLSADEKTAEMKAREKEKDDAKVWGEDSSCSRLRLLCLDPPSEHVTTLENPDAHFEEIAWNDDGTEIAVLEVRDTFIEIPYLYGTTLCIFNITSHERRNVSTFPTKLKKMKWAGSKIYAIGAVNTTSPVGDNTVYTLDLNETSPTWTRSAYGNDNSPMELDKAGRDITVKVEHGMEEEIQMFEGPTIFSKPKAIEAWDAAFTTDSDELIVAVAPGDINDPPEVFSVTASGGAMVKLSSHTDVLQGRRFGKREFLSCTSADGSVELDAVWVTPASAEQDSTGKPTKPLPTVVFIHGGPHGRATDSFFGSYFMWVPLLLDAGYAVLYPNYRGNSGRGETFAAHARGGVGTVEYEDLISLVQHTVELGYSDKERLIVSGWSQGGFLTYLSSVRNGKHGHGWKFKAGIAGAGVVDWDAMTLTSDYGATFQSHFAGKSPWKTEKTDVAGRKGSAIWEFKAAAEEGNIIPPILILHGESDDRVPLSQAVGFRRALQGAGLPFEMVVYPREGHIFKERRHWIDMAERVLRFVEKHLGKADAKQRDGSEVD